MARAKKPPLIADPTASQRIHAAADAAGMAVEDLADLIVEAGVRPRPTSDGITQRYTLEDLGSRLWGELSALPRDDRATWFAALLVPQKAAVVVVLRDQGYRSEVIAKELGIDIADVVRTWNAYSSNMGEQVVGIRLDTIAGQMQMAAERAQEMAIADGDHAAYWRIEKEKVQTLQSLGIVDQAIRRVEVTHKLTNETQQELDKLVDLRTKQQKRQVEIEELKQVDSGGDAIPDDVTEDYDDDDEA